MRPYVCDDCGARNCKMWRESNTFTSYIRLHCAPCAAAAQGRSIADIDSEGLRTAIEYDWGRSRKTDKIGSLVPAVPVNDTFWGYTSVPEAGVEWWRQLPTLPRTEQVGT